MTNALSEDDILLAGEYVLGLLEPDARTQAEQRMAEDGRFADEVAAWQQRLTPIFTAEAAPVPAGLWVGIRSALAGQDASRLAGAAVRFWKLVAGSSAAVAAGLALLLLTPVNDRSDPVPAAPTMVAALASPEGRGAMTIAFDPQRAELLITPVAIQASGRYPELWLIDARGEARSLGFVDAYRTTRLSVAPALRHRIRQGMALAVTLEGDRRAPHARAAGPVLVSGTLSAI